jgi:hypothetical protein
MNQNVKGNTTGIDTGKKILDVCKLKKTTIKCGKDLKQMKVDLRN